MPTMQDTRVLGYDPLVPPALLRHEIVSSETSSKNIVEARQVAAKIIAGEDDRVLVIVGPCSIHDPAQAIGEPGSRISLVKFWTEVSVEYAKRLQAKIPEWSNLLIIMRAYL